MKAFIDRMIVAARNYLFPERSARRMQPSQEPRKTVRVYLARQRFKDGRVMLRRWSPDVPGVPEGGLYQAQTKPARDWIARAGAPRWRDDKPQTVPMGMEPFEVLE